MEIPIRALRLNSNNDWVKWKERIGLIFFFSAYGFHLWHHPLFFLSWNFHKTKHKSIKSSRKREAKSFINRKVLQQFIKFTRYFTHAYFWKRFSSRNTQNHWIETELLVNFFFACKHFPLDLERTLNFMIATKLFNPIDNSISRIDLRYLLEILLFKTSFVTSRNFFISRLLSASVKIQLVSEREAKLNFFLFHVFDTTTKTAEWKNDRYKKLKQRKNVSSIVPLYLCRTKPHKFQN